MTNATKTNSKSEVKTHAGPENKSGAKIDRSTLGITVKKNDDMPEWYSQVVLKAELADYSPIKGCMVIRPYGYALWEKIQEYFNKRLEKRGVKNAYFPMFIPESFFKKEAEHAEGFKPEVAWVSNKDADSKERLAIRPTSETIMYDSYSRWIRSHRDLPLRINQWCNIVRWEVSDVKLFLRSREFLWQEGHCVYETEEECSKEVYIMLNEYKRLAEELLAVPVVIGKKTAHEKFAGAYFTTTIESLMPDGKALQMGTSHNLGQGFGKAFDIKYLGADEKYAYPWQSSWGFSTRLIGALVMMHGDDKGLVLPPSIAPIHAVIIPIIFKDSKDAVLAKCKEMKSELAKYSIEIDDRDGYKPGFKYNEWELKGVPIRIEFGPKDMDAGQAILVRRDSGEKTIVKLTKLSEEFDRMLDDIQLNLFRKSKKYFDESIVSASTYDEMMEQIKDKKMVKVPFCCEVSCEDDVKTKSGGVTTRCIPLDSELQTPRQPCMNCKKDGKHFVLFARNY